MAETDPREDAKKRIMFIATEDFNFLTYNLLLVLHELKCISPSSPFVDHRKLPFVVALASSRSAQRILTRHRRLQANLRKRDLHSISTLYTRSVSSSHLVERVIYVLSRRGLLLAEAGPASGTVDIWVAPNVIPASFFESELFQLERENIEGLRKLSPRIRSLKFETFLERFFADQGIQTWHA